MSYVRTTDHYWLAASQPLAVNPMKVRAWLDMFVEIQSLFSAPSAQLKAAGFTAREIQRLQEPDWNAIEKDLSWCERNQCQILTIHAENYPALLREIPDAPLVLYGMGKIELLVHPQIAIVGSRNPTYSGGQLAEQFGRELAKAGFVITSGLALGIDAASHKGALAAGQTIAVMGAGLKQIYPVSHQKLAEAICANGLLLSEFAPNELPKTKNFPLRNRIISGLSLGVLVVEAALRSGSLITARLAAEQGREVFAIPGAIANPMARGCHQLLRQGAKLIESAEDIIEELGALLDVLQEKYKIAIKPAIPADLVEDDLNLLHKIGYEVTGYDTIIARSGLTAGEVSSILLRLELKGYLQNVPGGYIRNTR